MVPEEIQQTMFIELLKLTQEILNQPEEEKAFGNAILILIFQNIHKIFNGAFNPICYNLIKGWMDILLTKSTPKPESYFTSPMEKAGCKLSLQGANNLLKNTAEYLAKHACLGGKDGVLLSNELTIMKLSLAEDLLKLLIYSEISNGLFAFKELLLHESKPEIQENLQNSLKLLIQWYLLNKCTDNGESPSTDLMKSISDNVKALFKIIGEFEPVAKLCLMHLITGCQEIDGHIRKFSKTNQISSYTYIMPLCA